MRGRRPISRCTFPLSHFLNLHLSVTAFMCSRCVCSSRISISTVLIVNGRSPSLLLYVHFCGSPQFSLWGPMLTSCFTACPATTVCSQTPWKCLPHCSPTWKSAKLCQRPPVWSFIVFTRCAVFLAHPSLFTLFRQFLSNLSDPPSSSPPPPPPPLPLYF